MKIDKLIKLAEEIMNYGVEVGFPQGYNFIEDLKVYYADQFRTQLFQVDDFEIAFYSKKFTMPFNCNQDVIDFTIEKVRAQFEAFKKTQEENGFEFVNNSRLQKIKELEAEIEKLKM